MSVHREKLLTSRFVVSFLEQYVRVLEMQIKSVETMMTETVTSVMTTIEGLSGQTEDKKNQAESALAQTYFNPDADTVELVESIQSSVDDIFEQAQKGITEEDSVVLKNGSVGAKLMRFGGLFSKHMESLSIIDDEIKAVLLKMMGALSVDDVIAQKLEHVEGQIHTLQVALANVLVDFETRFTLPEIESLKTYVLEFTLKQYTTEDERHLFGGLFPEALAHRKKAS